MQTTKSFKILSGAALVGSVAFLSSAGAAVYDLSQGPSSAEINGAIFYVEENLQTVGTGVIDSFLRIEDKNPSQTETVCEGPVSGNNTCEQGYNTSNQSPDKKVQYDEQDNQGSNWNHSLYLGDIPTIEIDGTEYLEFLLDVNEPKEQDMRFITLDELQFFVSEAEPNLYNDDANLFHQTTENSLPSVLPDTPKLVWELDIYAVGMEDVSGRAGTTLPDDATCEGDAVDCPPDGNPDSAGNENNTIKLDYANVGKGSGKGIDMVALIPKAVFTPLNGDQTVVTLFSRFGDVDFSQAGFEEWFMFLTEGGGGFTPPQEIPEPNMIALIGIGLLGAGVMARRRRKI